jgi:hypothetical protein
MTAETSMTVTKPATRSVPRWVLFCAFFVIAAGIMVIGPVMHAGTAPLFADTDDAMRMVVVRDLLGGQNWYDIVQHRLNTPYGAEVHWSRLVDLPIAILIAVVRPLAGAMTDTIVGYFWPLLLLLALLLLSVRLATRLAGPEGFLPGLVLPAFSPPLMAEFTPGRMDHHSIQILLTLLMAIGAVEAIKRPRFALLAGLAAATSLAVGTEALPSVVSTVLVFALIFVFDGERAGTLRFFGLSFAAATVIHLAIAMPPDRWFVPACDALSIVYTAAAVAVGLSFLVLSLLPLRQRPKLARLAVSAMVGTVVVAALVVLFPDCLRGPYAALDPWLLSHWLNRIVEAEPAWTAFGSLPAYVVAVTVPPLAGLAVVAWRTLRVREDRGEWLAYGLFLLTAAVVMLVQIRGSRLVAPLAVPAGAWLVVAARARYVVSGKLLAAAGLVGTWLVFAGIVLALSVSLIVMALPGNRIGAMAAAVSGRDACLRPQAFAGLAAMPPQRVMSFIDLGSHVLLNTPHSVVAAPYHRNQKGVREAFDFFNTPLEAARSILDARGVTLVVICPAMSEMGGLLDATPDSFVNLYAEGKLPGWLVEASPKDAPLKIYAVTPR